MPVILVLVILVLVLLLLVLWKFEMPTTAAVRMNPVEVCSSSCGHPTTVHTFSATVRAHRPLSSVAARLLSAGMTSTPALQPDLVRIEPSPSSRPSHSSLTQPPHTAPLQQPPCNSPLAQLHNPPTAACPHGLCPSGQIERERLDAYFSDSDLAEKQLEMNMDMQRKEMEEAAKVPAHSLG